MSAPSSPPHTERHPTDVAKLHGYRLVVAQETEKGRRWDETKIKSMTGGDKMTARFMRCDFFDFVPKFKLWIVGNHKPRLDNVDEAMRRRMLLVPFLVQIPAEERDPDLTEKLKAEWPAILRWCIDGCLEWQRTGSGPAQDRHRRHRRIFRRSGPHQAVARRLHRGRRPVRLHTDRPAVRLMENMVRRAKPQDRQFQSTGRYLGRPRVHQETIARGHPRLPQSRPKNSHLAQRIKPTSTLGDRSDLPL